MIKWLAIRSGLGCHRCGTVRRSRLLPKIYSLRAHARCYQCNYEMNGGES